MTNVEQAIYRAFQLFRTQVPLSGSEWANKHFYLVPESSGTEGRWQCYPYQVALLNWMTSDDIEEVNFMKSRRVGYTKCLLAAVACLIEQKHRNVVIWQPTDGDAKDFVTDEVDPMLRDVDAIGNILKCKPGMKSKFNTTEKKSFIGAILDIKGGKSARNYRRMTKDTVVYDEADAFDPDIDGEGNCFSLGDGRTDAAPFPKSIRGSTPKIKNVSIIESAVNDSDMIFWRYVKCPQCGELQRLEFARLIWEKDDPDSVVYTCVNGCVLHYRDYPDMDAAGRWQTLDGNYYDEARDAFFNADNERIKKPRSVGIRIWAAYSYLRPWSYIVDQWLKANRKAKTGDITSLKTVVNTLLGETFEESGEKINASSLTDRVEDYLLDGTIPNEVLVVCVGADVQGGMNPRVELEIVGYGLEDESWSLDYVVIPGDATEQSVWDHVDEQLQRRFVRQDGVELGISAAFIDSGYLANEVYKFTATRARRKVYATKGVNTGIICNKGTWQGEKKKRTRAVLRTVNVDDAKTIIFKRLQITEPGPGYCHFPSHYDDRHFVQLTNEEKREVHNKGVLVGYKWHKKGPNEQLDCRAYSMGALAFLNVNMPRQKLRLERMAEHIQGGVAAPRPKIELPKKESFVGEVLPKRNRVRRVVKKRGGGFVGRY